MIRVLHTGDLHLDSPFRALPPEKARQRREEQRELLERLAALAEERRGGCGADRRGPVRRGRDLL